MSRKHFDGSRQSRSDESHQYEQHRCNGGRITACGLLSGILTADHQRVHRRELQRSSRECDPTSCGQARSREERQALYGSGGRYRVLDPDGGRVLNKQSMAEALRSKLELRIWAYSTAPS